MGNVNPDSLIVIGRISKPRGLRGEVRVKVMTDFPERYTAGKSVLIGSDTADLKSVAIENVTNSRDDIILKLSGVEDRNKAESLRGWYVYAVIDENTVLPEFTYYEHDILAADVFDSSGKLLGSILRIEHYPASQMLVVGNDESFMLIPAVADYFISFDSKAKRLTLAVPDGLPTYRKDSE